MNETRAEALARGMVICEAGECPWLGFPDTRLCWRHSLGLPIREDDAAVYEHCGIAAVCEGSFAEALGGRTIEEARADERARDARR